MKNFLVALIAVMTSGLTYAGGVDGGGGKSVVCRDSNGQITKAELLDLYEGRIVFQLPYIESSKPWKEQSSKILPGVQGDIINWYNNIIAHMVILPEEVILKDTKDSFEVIAPKGCKIEQTAIYQNDNKILINGEIWTAFSETQKAALIVHEAIYRFLRDFGERNSIRARHLTAYVISGKEIEGTHVPKGFIGFCNSKNTSFYVMAPFFDEYGIEKLRFQFTKLGGKLVLSKKYVEFDNRVEMPGVKITISDFLKAPPMEDYGWIFAGMKTESLFEPNDYLDIEIAGKDDTGRAKIHIKGVSSIDEGHFESALVCNII